MKIKKLLAVLLVCVLMFAVGVMPAMAAEVNPAVEVQPRYAHFANIWADIYKEESGFYNISGGATVVNSTKYVDITVTLEKYGTSGWYVVNNCTWTGSGRMTAGAGGVRDLSTGTYRTHAVASCTQNGVLLETIEAYSDNYTVVKKN